MPHTFAALTNHHFRWLLCGNVAQFFAIASRMMICNLLAWQLTQQEISLALVNLSLAIPMFFGALIAGALVDRLERRRLMLLGLFVIVVSETSIFVALVTDQLVFPHLLVVTFIGGCAHPFINPASTAMMYALLGREKMANGVALLSSGMNLSRVLGPSITGFVLAFLNGTYAYLMVALLFSLSFVCQWQLPKNQPEVSKAKSVLSEIKSGLKYLFADKYISHCLLFSLLPLMLLMSVMYMLVVFADQVWGVGEAGLGIMLTAMGFGAFSGAMFVARFGNSQNRIKVMFVGAALCAIFYLLFSQSPSFILAVFFLAAANMCAAVALVTNQVIIQMAAKDEARGRVSGYILMSYSLAPLALFPLSTLVTFIGPADAVALAALIVIVLMFVLIVSSSTLKKLSDIS